MDTAFRPVSVRFTPGSYFFVIMSAVFLALAFLRFGHTFWWVYLIGGALGILFIPAFFFLYAVKQEYYVHHDIHSLDASFFGQSTDGTIALEEGYSENVRSHIAYTEYMGSLTFGEWLKLAFAEGIGHTRLTIRDSLLPVVRQTALFSVVIGMMASNIVLVGCIILFGYFVNR